MRAAILALVALAGTPGCHFVFPHASGPDVARPGDFPRPDQPGDRSASDAALDRLLPTDRVGEGDAPGIDLAPAKDGPSGEPLKPDTQAQKKDLPLEDQVVTKKDTGFPKDGPAKDVPAKDVPSKKDLAADLVSKPDWKKPDLKPDLPKDLVPKPDKPKDIAPAKDKTAAKDLPKDLGPAVVDLCGCVGQCCLSCLPRPIYSPCTTTGSYPGQCDGAGVCNECIPSGSQCNGGATPCCYPLTCESTCQ